MLFNSQSIQIYCVCCKEIRWATTCLLKKHGYEHRNLEPEMYPVSVCLDCEEEIVNRLSLYMESQTDEDE
ncbi:hypothetical protein A8990_101143 [Paenibacillus taihuensis]|uniref:Uncharacterized protein n=1 Tax=Paenibacillus taihuensis TaxID=1156355 RepID=A0A3D9SJ50_9BACL|nr:hypothetical protein A8990_101143 [Paenibacillus taihuensis]